MLLTCPRVLFIMATCHYNCDPRVSSHVWILDNLSGPGVSAQEIESNCGMAIWGVSNCGVSHSVVSYCGVYKWSFFLPTKQITTLYFEMSLSPCIFPENLHEKVSPAARSLVCTWAELWSFHGEAAQVPLSVPPCQLCSFTISGWIRPHKSWSRTCFFFTSLCAY